MVLFDLPNPLACLRSWLEMSLQSHSALVFLRGICVCVCVCVCLSLRLCGVGCCQCSVLSLGGTGNLQATPVVASLRRASAVLSLPSSAGTSTDDHCLNTLNLYTWVNYGCVREQSHAQMNPAVYSRDDWASHSVKNQSLATCMTLAAIPYKSS